MYATVHYDPKSDALCSAFFEVPIPKFREEADYKAFQSLTKVGTTLRCDVKNADKAQLTVLGMDGLRYQYGSNTLSTVVFVDRSSFKTAVEQARKIPEKEVTNVHEIYRYKAQILIRLRLDFLDNVKTPTPELEVRLDLAQEEERRTMAAVMAQLDKDARDGENENKPDDGSRSQEQ